MNTQHKLPRSLLPPINLTTTKLLGWWELKVSEVQKEFSKNLLERDILGDEITQLQQLNMLNSSCSLKIVQVELDLLTTQLGTTKDRLSILKEITLIKELLVSLSSAPPQNISYIKELKEKISLLDQQRRQIKLNLKIIYEHISIQEKMLIDDAIKLENARRSLYYLIERPTDDEPQYEMPDDWYECDDILDYVMEFLNDNFYARCIYGDYEKEFPGIKKILDNYDLISDLALKIAAQATDTTTTEDVLKYFQGGEFNFDPDNKFDTFVLKKFLEVISEIEMSEIVRLAEVIHMIVCLEDESFEIYQRYDQKVLLQGNKLCCQHEFGECEDGYNYTHDSECCCHKLHASHINIHGWSLKTKLEDKQDDGEIF